MIQHLVGAGSKIWDVSQKLEAITTTPVQLAPNYLVHHFACASILRDWVTNMSTLPRMKSGEFPPLSWDKGGIFVKAVLKAMNYYEMAPKQTTSMEVFWGFLWKKHSNLQAEMMDSVEGKTRNG